MEPKPLSLECDNCGAKISAHTAHGTYTCEYCGHRIQVRPPPATTPAPAKSNRNAVIILVAIVAVFLVGSIATSLVTCGAMATFFKLAQ